MVHCRRNRAGRMDDSDTLPFVRPDHKTKRLGVDKEPEEDVAPGNAFATARGLRTPTTLRFFRADGRLKFAMPYGYLPIIWGESSSVVVIEYPGFFTLMLAGKNLDDLESRLCDYRVTWVRECNEMQAAHLPISVTRIQRLASYPSREGETGGDS